MDIRPLILLSKAISAQHNVRVSFGRVDTATCSRTPDGHYAIELPFSDKENAGLLYRGYIDHEVGHVRFTDFNVPHTFNAVVRQLANVFEDEYVERRMGALFPGSKINLRDLARTIFTEEHVKSVLQGNDMSRIFAFALYHRRAMLDPELGKWHDKIDKALGVPENVLQDMLALVHRPTNSTEENNRLAQDLYDMFMQNQFDQFDQSDQSNSFQPSDFSVSDRVSQELDYKPFAECTPLEMALAEASKIAGAETASDNCLWQVPRDEGFVSALQKRIPALLQSSRIKPCTISSRGKLYGKRLARVAVLDSNVFHAPAKKLEQAIEVGFLSDYSSSMYDTSEQLDKAVYASLIMLKSLPKVKSFAYGFNGYEYRKLEMGYGLYPRGSTPLCGALLNIAQEFGQTGRRILIVTTDGRPDGPFERAQEVCSTLVKMGIELYGVGIGQGAAELYGLFGADRTIHIDTIAEYPACLEVMLRKAMLCVK